MVQQNFFFNHKFTKACHILTVFDCTIFDSEAIVVLQQRFLDDSQAWCQSSIQQNLCNTIPSILMPQLLAFFLCMKNAEFISHKEIHFSCYSMSLIIVIPGYSQNRKLIGCTKAFENYNNIIELSIDTMLAVSHTHMLEMGSLFTILILILCHVYIVVCLFSSVVRWSCSVLTVICFCDACHSCSLLSFSFLLFCMRIDCCCVKWNLFHSSVQKMKIYFHGDKSIDVPRYRMTQGRISLGSEVTVKWNNRGYLASNCSLGNVLYA